MAKMQGVLRPMQISILSGRIVDPCAFAQFFS